MQLRCLLENCLSNVSTFQQSFQGKPVFEVIIVGGGAAGFFVAANSGEKGRATLLLEASRETLSKVRISGGGRCNVTHYEFDPSRLVDYYPRGHRELRGAFSRFQPSDMIAWLKERRITTKVEEDGRVFPASDSSLSIVRCLERSAQNQGVQIRLRSRVRQIAKREGVFHVATEEGTIFSRNLVLATGGGKEGHRLAEQMGHTIVDAVPSLFSLRVKDARISGLAGLSFPDICLSLRLAHQKFIQRGPALVTHWGWSGPAMLKLSAWAARELSDAQYRGTLSVNFAPDHSEDALTEWFRQEAARNGAKHLESVPPPWLPRRYWRQLLECLSCPQLRWSQLSKKDLARIVAEISTAEFAFDGRATNKEEFVTAGGVRLEEVDLRTMESKVAPGLFVVGELLNVDGVTGGFNFQNAWTTGMLCAMRVQEGSRGFGSE